MTELLCVRDNNVNNLFVLVMGIRVYRVSQCKQWMSYSSPFNPIDLEGSGDNHDAASPSGDTSEALLGFNTIEQAGNYRSNGTTNGSSRSGKTVDLAEPRLFRERYPASWSLRYWTIFCTCLESVFSSVGGVGGAL